MAIKDTTKSLEACAKLKTEVLDKIKSVEEDFIATRNELLVNAGFDNPDELLDELKDDFFETISSDKEIQKKLKENSKNYEKAKANIRAQIISILKIKLKIHAFNQKAIEELKEDIKSIKRQKCKINESIVATEQAISDKKNEIAAKEQEIIEKEKEFKERSQIYVEAQKKVDEVTQKLADIDSELADAEEPRRTELINQRNALMVEKTNLPNLGTLESMVNNAKLEVDKSNEDLGSLKKDLGTLETTLNEHKNSLEGLNISDMEEKIATVEKGNAELLTEIDKDIEDYNQVLGEGNEIKKEEIIFSDTPDKSDEHDKSDNPEKSDKKDKSPAEKTPPKGTAHSQAAPMQSQKSDFPTIQTPQQISQNMFNRLMGNSDDDIRNFIAGNDLATITHYLGNCSKKEKEALMTKLNSLNSGTDFNKLSNVVTALQRSGVCSAFDIKTLVSTDGKIKDLSSLSNADLDNMTRFINELNQNKELIDADQFDFLNNNFVNAIKLGSLSQQLKPKKFRDFFKSRSARKADTERSAKLGNLHLSAAAVPLAEQKEQPTSFAEQLARDAYDYIQPNTHTPPTPQKERDKDR